MENDRVSNKKLPVARSNKECWKIYIERYDLCQRMKNRMEIPVEKLIANKILEKLQTYLTMNFITKLLLVAGKNVILVVCDKLSKIVHFIVSIKNIGKKFGKIV